MSLIKALGFYQKLLQTHPLKTNSLTTGILVAGGDYLAQKVFDPREKYDLIRTARMALLGVVLGPTLCKWYTFLEHKVGPSNTIKSCAIKLAIDQIGFAPFGCAFCISFSAALEGKDVEKELENNYLDVLSANYKLWPFVQVINFSVVPLHLRTLVVQTVALGWNTYLMWKLHI